jgi:outer membrane protein OmpA-like peptidoglycan-associated protein
MRTFFRPGRRATRPAVVFAALVLAIAVTGCSRDDKPAEVTASPPATVEPGKVEPGKVVPGKVVPGKVVPGKVDPAEVDPVEVDPVEADPFEVDPVEFDPVEFDEIRTPDVSVEQHEDLTLYTLPADVLFDFDEASIRPDARDALEEISASIAKRFPDRPLEIRGHTDAKGSDAYNKDLSERRAASVKTWLAANGGINKARMATFGFGETKPVAPNANPDGSDNPAGRQRNRRVEVLVKPA